MKDTKEVKEEEKEIFKIISIKDANEFKAIASGRKFCKKGEKLPDICDEEIERHEYETSNNIFVKILKAHKFKKNKEKFLLESRISSNIRAIAKNCIQNTESEELDRDEIIEKVKNIILMKVEEFKKTA